MKDEIKNKLDNFIKEKSHWVVIEFIRIRDESLIWYK